MHQTLFNWMKKSITLFAVLLFIVSCQEDDNIINQNFDDHLSSTYEQIEGQYIIVLKGQPSAKPSNSKYAQMKENLKSEIVSKFSPINLSKENILQTYGYSLNGFAAKLSDEQYKSLKNDDRIAYIENDYTITVGKPKNPGNGGGDAAQEKPWGITRVNGGVTYSGSNVAWVIDSGIDLDHPDLNTTDTRHASFLGGKDANDPDDSNGHGTHVAGTIAAISGNGIGVIGVAAGAKVVSVRVLDRRGSGSYSGVIAGVDYVGAEGQPGDVANMSLGGPTSKALDDAVLAASVDVIFVLAAGNESDHAVNHSPARVNGNSIYTISASDSNDNFASFSNYGNPPIDFSAPGVGIKSTWKKGEYNTISGTSMAAPHAAGVLLLGNAISSGTVKNDRDSSPDEIISH